MPENPESDIAPVKTVNDRFIETLMELCGSMKVLLSEPDAPIVFLIDERHKHVESTDENIANARVLVRDADVTLIGVESHEGGCKWDDLAGDYSKWDYHNGEDAQAINDWPNFADAMRRSAWKVVGVECSYLFDQQQGDFLFSNTQIQENRLNPDRSKHFIRTLLDLRSRNNLMGNLILNAGSEHQNHIEEWINDGTIESIAGQKASYVRLRASAYPK